MRQLGALGIDGLLLEGGSALAFSALEAGVVHRVQAYIAPKIIGASAEGRDLHADGRRFPD